MKSFRAALTIFITIAFVLRPGNVLFAQAMGHGATATSTSTIASSTFIAYATTSVSGANPNGTALTLANTSAAQFFYIRNTGSTTISRIAFSITYTSTPAKTNLLRCGRNIAFLSPGNCASGSTTSVIASTSLALDMSPGDWYEFEVNPKKTTTPTVSVSVSSTQIRPAIISNS